VHRTASFVLVPVPDYLETVPPSTGRSMPVMKLLSSEARNTTADASSSAVPSRPVGIIFPEVFACIVRGSFRANMDHGRLGRSRESEEPVPNSP